MSLPGSPSHRDLLGGPPPIAIPLYEQFVGMLEQILGQPVPTGEFGADMQVELLNDDPVTIVLDSPSVS